MQHCNLEELKGKKAAVKIPAGQWFPKISFWIPLWIETFFECQILSDLCEDCFIFSVKALN